MPNIRAAAAVNAIANDPVYLRLVGGPQPGRNGTAARLEPSHVCDAARPAVRKVLRAPHLKLLGFAGFMLLSAVALPVVLYAFKATAPYAGIAS